MMYELLNLENIWRVRDRCCKNWTNSRCKVTCITRTKEWFLNNTCKNWGKSLKYRDRQTKHWNYKNAIYKKLRNSIKQHKIKSTKLHSSYPPVQLWIRNSSPEIDRSCDHTGISYWWIYLMILLSILYNYDTIMFTALSKLI